MASLAAPTTDPTAVLIAEFTAGLAGLQAVWDEVGTPPADRTATVDTLLAGLRAQIQALQDDEVKVRDHYVDRFREAVDEFATKAAQLGKAETVLAPVAPGETLIDAVGRAEETLHALNIEHKQVVQVHQAKLDEIKALHVTLQGNDKPVPPRFADLGPHLSSERRAELDEQLRVQRDEKANRVVSRSKIVTEICDLQFEMNMPWDTTPFEGQVKHLAEQIEQGNEADEAQIGLTIFAMVALSDFSTQLNDTKTERLERIQDLACKIKALWEKLEIADAEREAFFNQHDGLGTEEIRACEGELARLQELKKQRLKPMIEAERAAVAELYDNLHYSAAQRAEFALLRVPEADFTEATLDAHEAHTRALTAQYKVQKPIMANLEKRALWLSYGDKLKQPRPAGKNSREKAAIQREYINYSNKFKKGLPKLDVALRDRLVQWKAEYGTPLTYDGKDFLAIIEEAIDEREGKLRNKRATIKANALKSYQGKTIPGKRPLQSKNRK